MGEDLWGRSFVLYDMMWIGSVASENTECVRAYERHGVLRIWETLWGVVQEKEANKLVCNIMYDLFSQ